MSITLSNLKPSPGSHKRRKRVGRGNASGGNYSGRGMKGQRARSGGRKGLKRIGMKMMVQRVPKHRGFKSIHPRPAVVDTAVLEKHFASGDAVTLEKLRTLGIIKRGGKAVKILSGGALTKALIVRGCLVSGPARDKIEKAGGKVE